MGRERVMWFPVLVPAGNKAVSAGLLCVPVEKYAALRAYFYYISYGIRKCPSQLFCEGHFLCACGVYVLGLCFAQ